MKQLIVFILLSGFVCWLMFAPIYKHVLVVRQAVLQKEVDLLLEVGTNASHGYIDDAMMNQSRNRLIQMGFDSHEIQYTVRTTNGKIGTDPTQPIMRGEGLQLQISYSMDNPYMIDRLIGIITPATSRMTAGGLKMSEYVP